MIYKDNNKPTFLACKWMDTQKSLPYMTCHTRIQFYELISTLLQLYFLIVFILNYLLLLCMKFWLSDDNLELLTGNDEIKWVKMKLLIQTPSQVVSLNHSDLSSPILGAATKGSIFWWWIICNIRHLYNCLDVMIISNLSKYSLKSSQGCQHGLIFEIFSVLSN